MSSKHKNTEAAVCTYRESRSVRLVCWYLYCKWDAGIAQSVYRQCWGWNYWGTVVPFPAQPKVLHFSQASRQVLKPNSLPSIAVGAFCTGVKRSECAAFYYPPFSDQHPPPPRPLSIRTLALLRNVRSVAVYAVSVFTDCLLPSSTQQHFHRHWARRLSSRANGPFVLAVDEVHISSKRVHCY
jgi:hypothetical protein